MTCGFYLGILLLRVLQALQVCSAWSQGDLSHVHGRFEGSSPQGDIRQAFVAKSSSTNHQGPYNKRPPYLASPAQSVKYYQSSLTNAKSYNTDTTFIRRGNSVSKHESFKQHNGVVRTLPSKQGSRRLGPYAKPDGYSSTQHQSGSRASAWNNKKLLKKPVFDKSALLTAQKEKGFIPPKEHSQATSGLSRGSRVNANGGRRKTHASRLHETSMLPMPWKFGFPQPHLVSLAAGVKLAPEQQSGPGQGLRYAPVIVHYIPQQFGGYPIKRLGDEKPVARTTTPTRPAVRPSTLPQVRRYTFPPRHAQTLKPRKPSVHKSSKWIRIQSKQLTGD